MNEFIEREALLKHLNECAKDEFFDSDMARAVVGISVYVEMMPTADVQPVKRGKWIEQDMYYVCSNCKHEFLNDILGIAIWGNGVPYFCPNCGADMRGENDG